MYIDSEIIEDYLARRMTDFTPVDDQEYAILRKAANDNEIQRKTPFVIIERLDYKEEFIPNTVKDYLEIIAQRDQEKKQRAQEAEERRQAKILAQLAKDEQKEKKLLESLIAKHGVPPTV